MKKAPALKEMLAAKEDMATSLQQSLSAQFNGASVYVGHGVAKDKNENLSYYFRVYAPGGDTQEIKKASESFIAAKRPGAPVIVTVTDLAPQSDDNPKPVFDIGVGYVGPGVRGPAKG